MELSLDPRSAAFPASYRKPARSPIKLKPEFVRPIQKLWNIFREGDRIFDQPRRLFQSSSSFAFFLRPPGDRPEPPVNDESGDRRHLEHLGRPVHKGGAEVCRFRFQASTLRLQSTGCKGSTAMARWPGSLPTISLLRRMPFASQTAPFTLKKRSVQPRHTRRLPRAMAPDNSSV
jgi:hypothetical protein